MATHTVLLADTRIPVGTVPSEADVLVWLMNHDIMPQDIVVTATSVSFTTPNGAPATKAAAILTAVWPKYDDARSRRQKAMAMWVAANALPQSTATERDVKLAAMIDAVAMAVAALLRDD